MRAIEASAPLEPVISRDPVSFTDFMSRDRAIPMLAKVQQDPQGVICMKREVHLAYLMVPPLRKLLTRGRRALDDGRLQRANNGHHFALLFFRHLQLA